MYGGMTRNEVRGLLALAILIAVGVGIRSFSARREGAGVWVEHPAAQASAAGPNKGLLAPAGRNIPFTQPSRLPRRLNLNTATEEDLAEALPGIGAAKARAIVTRRVQKGGFRNVRELLEVPGIGQKTLEKLEPLLFVSGDPASTASLMARPFASPDPTTSSLPAAVPAATLAPQVASPPLSPALPEPAVPAPAAPLVPTPAPTAPPPFPPASDASNLININTASPEALQTLTHIGPKRARDIVLYRQTHGLFRRIEDLQNVPGIGPGILEENRNRIRVR